MTSSGFANMSTGLSEINNHIKSTDNVAKKSTCNVGESRAVDETEYRIDVNFREPIESYQLERMVR